MPSNKRIATRSRSRFIFPSSRRGINVEAEDKTQWVGPLTRAQMVELIWRVKKLRFTASFSCTFTYLKDEGGESVRVSGSESHTKDMTYTRMSRRYDLDAVAEPYFTDKVSTELSMLEDNLFERLDGDGVETWFFYNAAETSFLEPYPFPSSGINVDDSGEYWWRPAFDFQIDDFGGISGGRLFHGEYNASGFPHSLVTLELDIGGSIVDFPVVFFAKHGGEPGATSIADIDITAASGTVKITEWFPYATGAGDPAWNTATGAPANGGPGA